MKPPKLLDLLDDDSETWDRLLSRLHGNPTQPGVFVKMAQQLPGDLTAASYDSEGGGSVAWCDIHEREVTACHKRDLLCRGVPLPRVTDPTGDAVVNGGHDFYRDLREMQELARARRHNTEQWMRLVLRYDVEDQTPDQRDDAHERNTQVFCEWHTRFGFTHRITDNSPILSRTKGGTRVSDKKGGYVLQEAKRLCEFCEDVVQQMNRLPLQWEVEQNANGKRRLRAS